jgi:hypothetical protein
VRPDAGEAVGLEFGADETPFGAGLARALAEDAEQVLDVGFDRSPSAETWDQVSGRTRVVLSVSISEP